MIYMFAKAAKLGVVGFCLGMVVGALIAIFEGLADGGSLVLSPSLLSATGSEAGALLAHMLLSGVAGAVPWAGIVIYEIDSWGLLKQAAVHYASYTVACVAIGLAAGWIGGLADVVFVAGIFLVGHCIIWTVMYLRYKAVAEELNALLREARQGA